jgi:hypothetical protein
VLAREWLDYATERVPSMRALRSGATRELVLADEPDAAGDADGQRPRVFYRRELDATPFVIRRR